MILSGIRVVEFAQGVAGPMSAVRLGDLGASVIKVEPAEGDWTRGCPPFMPDSEMSATFFALNRGKRSVALGRRPEAAAVLLQRLVQRADVFITDRTAGKLSETGLAAIEEEPCSLNPRLIVANISAFGAKGPMANRPGSELVAQAMAGYTRSLGAHHLPARRLGADVAGAATATFTTQAVLAALLWRNRTGEGQRVSLSLLNSLLSMKTIHLAAQSDPDKFEGPRVATANVPPLRGYRTADCPITFGMGGVVGKDGRPGWVPFVKELGLERLLDDPRFDGTGRHDTGLGARAIGLKEEYEREFVKYPGKLIVETARKYGGIASEYARHDELFAGPQAEALGLARTVPADGEADARVLAFPARFSRAGWEPRGVAPALGQHTIQVALKAGLSQEEVERLLENGGLGQWMERTP